MDIQVCLLKTYLYWYTNVVSSLFFYSELAELLISLNVKALFVSDLEGEI